MRSTLPAAIVATIVLAIAPMAKAVPCGDVTSAGVCSDSKTLVFCDRGSLETVACPSGEICTHDERFGGAAGCIATAMAGCGDVPEGGACAGSETLVFCEHRAVVERRCPAGTVCTWVADEAWYDCVSPHAELPATPTEPDPDGPAEPKPTPEPEPTPNPPDDSTEAERVAPTVSPGGAPAAGEFVAGGSGCGGGGTGLLLWPLGVLLASFRRR